MTYKKAVSAEGAAVLKHRPVIVGFGPAGMFAGLILAQAGYRPLVLERGQDVDSRTTAVEKFWETGELDTESNVQFGEGGAGTFSDGKLTTGIKDVRIRKVLEELVRAGSPEDILYKQKPHVGTDVLRGVVKSVREEIKALGGDVMFRARVSDFVESEGKLSAVELADGRRIDCETAVFAIGHSSRDTFRWLYPDLTGAYSWWSFRSAARSRNAGWRIDYFIVSDRLRDNISKAYICSEILGSDHCPVGLDLTW